MSVYILHLSPPLKHARHYVGFSEQVKKRFNHHLAGTGSRFTQVCREKGITLTLAVVIRHASREDERRIKTASRMRLRERCPVCFILTVVAVANLRGKKLNG
jgi:predicted GIY-YIG superfamily endonuclease